jgi:hypothetical protein
MALNARRPMGHRAVRWSLIGLGLLLVSGAATWEVLVVAYLAPGRADGVSHDPWRAQPGRPLVSPSGQFVLKVRQGPLDEYGLATWQVWIEDRSGHVVYNNPMNYAVTRRFGVGVMWSPRKDQAWMDSNDVGTTVVAPDPATGKWTERDAAGVPAAEVPEPFRSRYHRWPPG